MDETDALVFEKGYLRRCFLISWAFLGWNPGDDREIFSMEELIRKHFRLNDWESATKLTLLSAKWCSELEASTLPPWSQLLDFWQIVVICDRAHDRFIPR